ncbi:MAG: class I SAM-dependent methyltransferase [Saprospiraceae bacterium]|nr:class I SAM-dependent methyltransferase [Saprospiraceae bacterium]
MATNSLTRFSNTVENYIRFRPGYPLDLLAFMESKLSLSAQSVIADIGAGTGKLTELFLQNDNPTLAVEPNADMRAAAERLFGHFPNLQTVNGTAEITTLPDHCADFVVAGQAFHWFDQMPTKQEFLRILKPGGWVLLIWNDRNDARSEFMRDYDAFLRSFSTDLDKIDHRHIGDEQLKPFFGKNGFAYHEIDYLQTFDLEGVKGRYLSCSYAFDEKHPRHAAAMQGLNDTFEAHSDNGKVDFWYLTKVYYGQMA